MFSCLFLIRVPELCDCLVSYLALATLIPWALNSQKVHSHLVLNNIVMLESASYWWLQPGWRLALTPATSLAKARYIHSCSRFAMLDAYWLPRGTEGINE